MEPYRIPFAGRVTTCCFDKTGTLTEDNFEVDKVDTSIGSATPVESPSDSETQVESKKNAAASTGPLGKDNEYYVKAVAAACQSLLVIKEELVGDPLEKALLEFSGFEIA